MVTDAPPIVSGIPVHMTQGVHFTAPLAFLVEGVGPPPEPASHFTGTINWGDGTTSAGLIEAVPGGEWVVGSHAYANAGPYTITLTIHTASGLTAVGSTEAFDPPPPAGPLQHPPHVPVRHHPKPVHAPAHPKSAPAHEATHHGRIG